MSGVVGVPAQGQGQLVSGKIGDGARPLGRGRHGQDGQCHWGQDESALGSMFLPDLSRLPRDLPQGRSCLQMLIAPASGSMSPDASFDV